METKTAMIKPTNQKDAQFQPAYAVFDEMRTAGKSTQEIFCQLYDQLKTLARKRLKGEPAGRSMHATRLLSDLLMRLFGHGGAEFEWESAEHFFNTMSRAMEQLLIDSARKRGAQRRGGGKVLSLEELAAEGYEPFAPEGLLGKGIKDGLDNKNWFEEKVLQALIMDSAMEWLEYGQGDDERKSKMASRQAEIVRLRVLLGLTEEETAELLGCSSETVTKEFRKAKAALASYLQENPPPAGKRPNQFARLPSRRIRLEQSPP